ncbi:MAG TPA: hypothetical protein DCS93_17185 [Microscillaceae bacterium]|nr:hypothetical protein [Microscillaceae bacterium]
MDGNTRWVLITNTKTSLHPAISPNIYQMWMSPKKGNNTRLNYLILYFKLIVFYCLINLQDSCWFICGVKKAPFYFSIHQKIESRDNFFGTIWYLVI